MVQPADLLRSHKVKENTELKGRPDDKQTEVHLNTPTRCRPGPMDEQTVFKDLPSLEVSRATYRILSVSPAAMI